MVDPVGLRRGLSIPAIAAAMTSNASATASPNSGCVHRPSRRSGCRCRSSKRSRVVVPAPSARQTSPNRQRVRTCSTLRSVRDVTEIVRPRLTETLIHAVHLRIGPCRPGVLRRGLESTRCSLASETRMTDRYDPSREDAPLGDAGGAELHAVVPNPTAISAAKNVHLTSLISPAPERGGNAPNTNNAPRRQDDPVESEPRGVRASSSPKGAGTSPNVSRRPARTVVSTAPPESTPCSHTHPPASRSVNRPTCKTCAAVGRGVPPAYDISCCRITAALHRPSMAPATVSEMWCWPR